MTEFLMDAAMRGPLTALNMVSGAALMWLLIKWGHIRPPR